MCRYDEAPDKGIRDTLGALHKLVLSIVKHSTVAAAATQSTDTSCAVQSPVQSRGCLCAALYTSSVSAHTEMLQRERSACIEMPH
eukprot:18888-Heterococcus_DN1.PRE.4